MSTAVAYSIVTATPFAMTAGAKTALMAIAPAGHGLSLVSAAVSFDGVTTTAVPALVEIVTSTQAGAGTPTGATTTITQIRGRTTAGSAPTSGGNYSAEPTVLVRVGVWYIPQFMSGQTIQLPLGREIECDSSAGTIRGLGIRITVTANVNAVCSMEVENL